MSLSWFKLMDAYSLRARLFPAIIAAAPALAALALLISWDKIALSNVIATGALLVLLFALADFARKQGLRIEPTIYSEMGGKPSIVMMRRSDQTIDQNTKDRYRTFLASKVNRPPPTAEEEAANQSCADSFYEQCGIWLRDNTRDAKRFPILFGENVSYGFNRNLRGLKWIALALNVIVVVICAALLLYPGIVDPKSELTARILVVLIVAAIHAVYVVFAVTKNGVKQAARKYGRELILSCETLSRSATTSAPRAPRKRKMAGTG
jgi:hypothetical protein